MKRGQAVKTSVRWQVGSAALALAGILFGPIAVAEIAVTPRLQLQQTWTDTANLDIQGTNGDYITTISPGVNISGSTARVQTFIDYTLNGLIFFKQDENSDIRHQLQAAINTEVVRDRFFVDVRGGIQQLFQDFGGQIININQNFTANRITTKQVSVSPRYTERLGNFATATATYNLGFLTFGDEGAAAPVGNISDSINHNVRFSLNSGPQFDRFRWNWSSSYQRNRQTFSDVAFERYNSLLDLNYDISRKTSLVGSVGYEEFDSTNLPQSQSGVIWDVGLRLTPGPRTSIEGRVGQRFGGTVFSASATYRFNASDTVTARYDETVNLLNPFGGGGFDPVQDQDGDNIPDFGPPSDEIFGETPFVSDALFQAKGASVTLSRALRRTTMTLNGFWRKQRALTAGGFTGENYGAFFNAQYRIDSAQSVGAGLFYSAQNFDTTAGQIDFVGFSPQYTYAFSPNLNASVRYNFTKRFSQVPALDRATNAVTISLLATF